MTHPIIFYVKKLYCEPDIESVKNNSICSNMLIDKLKPLNQITTLFDSILSIFSYSIGNFLQFFFSYY